MGRQSHLKNLASAQILALVQIADSHFSCKTDSLCRNRKCNGRIRRIIQCHRPRTCISLFYILGKNISLAVMLDDMSLKSQTVLVDGDKLRVGDYIDCLLRDICKVTADKKRGTHRTPHGEMRLLLIVCKAEIASVAVFPER